MRRWILFALIALLLLGVGLVAYLRFLGPEEQAPSFSEALTRAKAAESSHTSVRVDGQVELESASETAGEPLLKELGGKELKLIFSANMTPEASEVNAVAEVAGREAALRMLSFEKGSWVSVNKRWFRLAEAPEPAPAPVAGTSPVDPAASGEPGEESAETEELPESGQAPDDQGPSAAVILATLAEAGVEASEGEVLGEDSGRLYSYELSFDPKLITEAAAGAGLVADKATANAFAALIEAKALRAEVAFFAETGELAEVGTVIKLGGEESQRLRELDPTASGSGVEGFSLLIDLSFSEWGELEDLPLEPPADFGPRKQLAKALTAASFTLLADKGPAR